MSLKLTKQLITGIGRVNGKQTCFGVYGFKIYYGIYGKRSR